MVPSLCAVVFCLKIVAIITCVVDAQTHLHVSIEMLEAPEILMDKV